MTTTKPRKPRAARAKQETAEHWSDKYAGLITYEQAKEIADEISRERGYQIDIGTPDEPIVVGSIGQKLRGVDAEGRPRRRKG